MAELHPLIVARTDLLPRDVVLPAIPEYFQTALVKSFSFSLPPSKRGGGVPGTFPGFIVRNSLPLKRSQSPWRVSWLYFLRLSENNSEILSLVFTVQLTLTRHIVDNSNILFEARTYVHILPTPYLSNLDQGQIVLFGNTTLQMLSRFDA